MKKAIVTSCIALLLILMTSFSALAVGEITVNEVRLGGTSQARSNPKADDVNARVVNLTGTVTFKNTGAVAITEILPSANADAKFKVSFSDIPLSVNPNTESTFKVILEVPKDLSSFFETRTDANDDRKVDIGDISITANNASATGSTGSFFLQAENQLDLDDIKVEVNGESENVDDGDDVKVKPGDKVVITVKAKNTYSSSDDEDLSIEDIEADIDVADDGDFDIDEDNIDFGDLDAKESSEETITIDVAEDATKDDHDVNIVLRGKDENGASHGEKLSFTLKVERERNEIKIQTLTITPQSLTCQTRSVEVSTKVLNLGRDDEDEVSLKLEIPGLNYNERIYDLSLDEDDEMSKNFRVSIPESLKAGEYPVTIESYYDRTKISDTKASLLSVPDCKPIVVTPPVILPPVIVTPPEPSEDEEIVESDTVLENVSKSQMYVWALGIVVVMLVVIVLVLAAKFIFGKEE